MVEIWILIQLNVIIKVNIITTITTTTMLMIINNTNTIKGLKRAGFRNNADAKGIF